MATVAVKGSTPSYFSAVFCLNENVVVCLWTKVDLVPLVVRRMVKLFVEGSFEVPTGLASIRQMWTVSGRSVLNPVDTC